MLELYQLVFKGTNPETLDPGSFMRLLFFIILLQFVASVISDLVNLTRR